MWSSKTFLPFAILKSCIFQQQKAVNIKRICRFQFKVAGVHPAIFSAQKFLPEISEGVDFYNTNTP